MAAESFMRLAVGTPLPAFSLPDVTAGALVSSTDFSSDDSLKGLLVVFLCRHCPYVVHVRDVLNGLAREFRDRGIATVGICANDPDAYPDDAPERLAEMVVEHGLCFPILFDKTQEVARSFDAACTPDFFLFVVKGGLYYRGRMDDSTPGNGRPVTGNDLRSAMEGLLADSRAPAEQLPSIGCSIKWRQ